MVAPQSLNLLVGVRVPIPQPKMKASTQVGAFIFVLLSIISSLLSIL